VKIIISLKVATFEVRHQHYTLSIYTQHAREW